VPASLSIGDVTVIEGDSGTQTGAVVVTLSEPTTKNVTVNYTTANGSALVGSDYNKVSGKLTFAPGETSKSILVSVRGDMLSEFDESFFVRLSRAKGATIGDSQGTVTITDNVPRLSFSGQVAEEGELMTFTVTLSAPLDQPFTVNFATQDASPTSWNQPMHAYAGQDYVAASGTLTFAPGQLTQTFTVQIIADSVPEYDEYFNIQLSAASAEVVYPRIGFPGNGQGIILGEYGVFEL
jgi:hypothetical protein